jgi:hypothetical protein
MNRTQPAAAAPGTEVRSELDAGRGQIRLSTIRFSAGEILHGRPETDSRSADFGHLKPLLCVHIPS